MSSSRASYSLTKIAALLLTLAAIAWFFEFAVQLEQAFLRFQALGTIGIVLFISSYVVATVLLVPVSLLSLAAGAVYGLSAGFIYVTIAANVGALSSFLLGRYLGRSSVTAKLDQYPRFAALDQAIGVHGWQIVALCRLSPLFPFNTLNYFFGFSQVRFTEYALATFLGMLPGTFLYLYIGSLAGDISGGNTNHASLTLRILGLLATLAATLYLARIAKKSIDNLSAIKAEE